MRCRCVGWPKPNGEGRMDGEEDAAPAPQRLCNTRSRWNAVFSGQICSNGKPLKKQEGFFVLWSSKASSTVAHASSCTCARPKRCSRSKGTGSSRPSRSSHRIQRTGSHSSVIPLNWECLGDTVELGMSHDYVALLARQQGITLRNFQNESQAIEWVRDRRQPGDRRHQSEQTLRAPLERRQSQRRKPLDARLTRRP